MCNDCIHFGMCNLGIRHCEDFENADYYIEENKILFRKDFFEMMKETYGGESDDY